MSSLLVDMDSLPSGGSNVDYNFDFGERNRSHVFDRYGKLLLLMAQT